MTLASGHTALTERAEVGADTLARLRPLIADMMAGNPEPPRTRDIPSRPAFMLQCVRFARGAPLFRVYGLKPVPREGAELPCIVSFGVAVVGEARAFAPWDALHAMPDAAGAPATDATEPPAAAPCIAWTLWEQHHGQRH